VLKWLRGDDIEIHCTTSKRFRDDFIKWQIESGVTTYSKIFVVALDLAKCLDVVDLPNCVVVDNHQTHVIEKIYTTTPKRCWLTQAQPPSCCSRYSTKN